MKKSITLLLAATLSVAAAWAVPPQPQPAGEHDDGWLPSSPELVNGLSPRTPADYHTTWAEGPEFQTHGPQAASAKSAVRDVKAPARIVTGVDLRGCVIMQPGWTNTSLMGLYTIPRTGPVTERYAQAINATYGVYIKDNVLYTPVKTVSGSNNFYYLDRYDMATWNKLGRKQLTGANCMAQASATDPSTGEYFGTFYNPDESGFFWGKGDLSEATPYPTELAKADGTNVPVYAALGINKEGTIYGITWKGDFGTVNRQTGVFTKIGPTGVVPKYLHGAVVDPRSGRFFWCPMSEDGSAGLYEVDTATGVARLINEFYGNEITGMYVEPNGLADGVPGAVRDLKGQFAGASLSGSLTFTGPTTTVDNAILAGDPITGNVTYNVYLRDSLIWTSANLPGAAITVPVTVPEKGNYVFTVGVASDKGEGPREDLKIFIGADQPVTTTLTAVQEGAKINLTWTPVTTGVNYGYIDPAAVTYTVRNNVNGEVLKQNLTDTATVLDMSSVTDFTYVKPEVVAVNDGVESVPAVAQKFAFGTIHPRWSVDFLTDQESLTGFTIIDGNNSGGTWYWWNASYGVFDQTNVSKGVPENDWLITPPIHMEAGKSYYLAMVDYTGMSKPEDFRMCVGNAPTPDAMTTQLLDFHPVGSTMLVKKYDGAFFTPAETGEYYMGVHVYTKDTKSSWGVMIGGIEIKEGVAGQAPAALDNVTYTPSADYANVGNLSMTMPTTTFDGQPLTELLSVEVMDAQHNVLTTIASPKPGRTYVANDVPGTPAGSKVYARCLNAVGASPEATITAYTGKICPNLATDVVMTEPSTGDIAMTWQMPVTDKWGQPIDQSILTNAVKNGNTLLMDYCRETRFEQAGAVAANAQSYLQYTVNTKSDASQQSAAKSQPVPVGGSYRTPFLESFKDGKASTMCGTTKNSPLGGWKMASAETAGMPASIDGDNGYAYFGAIHPEEYGDFYTGKIKVPDADDQYMSFFTYNYRVDSIADDNLVSVTAYTQGSNTPHQLLAPTPMSQLCKKEGWNKISTSLDQYRGKSMWYIIHFECVNYLNSLLDRFEVRTAKDVDLANMSVLAPETVSAGQDFDISVSVVNDGRKASPETRVELWLDNKLLDTKTLQGLDADDVATVNFTQSLSSMQKGANKYHTVVVYDADELPDNNEQTVTVTCEVQPYPTATLSGMVEEGTPVLSWTAPDVASKIERVTEGFEDTEGWAHAVDGWVIRDVDGLAVGGFSNTKLPGFTTNQTKSSWFVFEFPADSSYHETFGAYEGSKYLACLYTSSRAAADDWAISPRVDDKHFSFYAHNYWGGANVGEIQVMAGVPEAPGSSVVTFTLLETIQPSSDGWTKYEFTLPDDAEYFALRNNSKGAYFLMVDNVEMSVETNEAVKQGLRLGGYNVYRDSRPLAGVDSATLTLRDADAADGDHRYVVTALYTGAGESEPSNEVSLTRSGLDAAAIAGRREVSRFDASGRRASRGQQGVMIIRYSDGTAAKQITR